MKMKLHTFTNPNSKHCSMLHHQSCHYVITSYGNYMDFQNKLSYESGNIMV